MISDFILAISFRISLKISCFMASNSVLDAAVELFEVALLMAFSAIPFNLRTSIKGKSKINFEIGIRLDPILYWLFFFLSYYIIKIKLHS